MAVSIISILWTVWDFFFIFLLHILHIYNARQGTSDFLFQGFASSVVIVVLLDIKPLLAENIWASKAIMATFTLVSQTPAKSH